jgi:hypothetical protein
MSRRKFQNDEKEEYVIENKQKARTIRQSKKIEIQVQDQDKTQYLHNDMKEN